MICDIAREWMPRLLDDELDANQESELERHLKTCFNCAEQLSRSRILRDRIRGDAPYHTPPETLTARVRESLRTEASRKRARWAHWWPKPWIPAIGLAAIVAIFSAGLYNLNNRISESQLRQVDEVVSNHIRSLLPGHLIDIPSSDQHTVKPWFNGKLDFSPRVENLDTQGFDLKGGRLDYLHGRNVAVVVFARRQHLINLFISRQAPEATESQMASHGYNVLRWADEGLSYWAVSDLNPGELGEFARVYQRGR